MSNSRQQVDEEQTILVQGASGEVYESVHRELENGGDRIVIESKFPKTANKESEE